MGKHFGKGFGCNSLSGFVRSCKRGHHEKVGERVAQGGNFLGVVTMLSEFDTITNDAISLPKYAARYTSSKIQNELTLATS